MVRGSSSARTLLDLRLAEESNAELGPVIQNARIKSTLAPFNVIPQYKVTYPPVVIEALCDLYREYNQAFTPLISANSESESDYRFCKGPDGHYINYFVQIDMVGLPDPFLREVKELHKDEVREALRGRIFEIENSLAYYQLLEGIFHVPGAAPTEFRYAFRKSLDDLRARHGKPIALLAITEKKYDAMRAAEFGKTAGEPLTDSEVKELSGFDAFFGPKEFQEMVTRNGGRSEYLLYVRASDPIEKLANPNLALETPLLLDEGLRRVIKEYSLTLNIDAPHALASQRINDTKAYLPPMGMAYAIDTEHQLYSPEFAKHLVAQRPFKEFAAGTRLSREFSQYLSAHGFDLMAMESGSLTLRAKPLRGTYGCYGHLRGTLSDTDFRAKLRTNLKKRGSYILQPEIGAARAFNQSDGERYTYIDRNLLAFSAGRAHFLGGFRTLLPTNSDEARNGRIHGAAAAAYAEIKAGLV
jgi:hypothetical protein